jgi:hypothetical protein
MPTLRETLNELAASFASDVVDAIRGASLDDLLTEGGGGRPAAAQRPAPPAAPRGVTRAAVPALSGRLPRRSATDVATALESVVRLLRVHKAGLRAEQIRAELKMRPNEMPRVLKEGLAKKVLKSRGAKRATTYSLA